MDGTRNLAVFVLITALGAGGSLTGQSQVVVPPDALGTAATGSTNVPFGRSTPMRMQAAYDPLQFQGPLVVSGLALRLDENRQNAGKRVELECRMSTMAAGIIRLQEAFASNRGADETVVVGRRILDLPALALARSPSPFDLKLALDRPFAYDPARGSLVLEIVVFGQQPGSYPLDSTWLCDSPVVRYGPPGCGPAGGKVLDVRSLTQSVTWGRNLALSVFDAEPLAVTGMMFGVRESGLWNGIPIPFDLAPLGAPGCHLSIDPLVVGTQLADATGSAVYNLFIPSMPWLKGRQVRFQGFAVDQAANALGIVATKPAKVAICGWEAVGRVYAAGLSSTTGLRELGVAPVLQLSGQ